jgi:hypothetical protein
MNEPGFVGQVRVSFFPILHELCLPHLMVELVTILAIKLPFPQAPGVPLCPRHITVKPSLGAGFNLVSGAPVLATEMVNPPTVTIFLHARMERKVVFTANVPGVQVLGSGPAFGSAHQTLHSKGINYGVDW